MKLYVILVLCIAVVHGDKKINLEDIERDNLKSEAQSGEDNVKGEVETKYNLNTADSNSHLQYQTQSQLITGQQPQQIKYVVQPDYTQDLQGYEQVQEQQQQQQQHNVLLEAQAQQSQSPQQFYTQTYQTQKSSPQISGYQPHLTQTLSYQGEVPIGNQIQSYQQRTATHKFTQGISNGNEYAEDTAGKQLVYYTTPSVSASSKNQIQPLLHRLATQAAQNVKLSDYTPNLTQEPKVTYQPQIQYVYEPQYVPSAGPIYTAKDGQKFTYAIPQTYSSPQSYSGLTYTQQNSLYTQPKLPITQAYFTQPQLTQYYPEPAYLTSLAQQGNQLSYTQSQPFYVSPKLVQQLSSQFIKQQNTQHGIAGNFAKIPQVPRYTLTVPQVPAQNFKSGGITQLRPVNSGQSHIEKQLYYSSGPQSLLDSYIPSIILAARDSERYRERPLHLESGFLPSKGSYAHTSHNQKRKSQ